MAHFGPFQALRQQREKQASEFFVCTRQGPLGSSICNWKKHRLGGLCILAKQNLFDPFIQGSYTERNAHGSVDSWQISGAFGSAEAQCRVPGVWSTIFCTRWVCLKKASAPGKARLRAFRRVGAPVEEHIHPCISLILKLGFKAETLGTRTEVEVVVVVVQARRSQPGKCSHVMSRLSASCS